MIEYAEAFSQICISPKVDWEKNMAKSKCLTKTGGKDEFVILFSISYILEIFHLKI